MSQSQRRLPDPDWPAMLPNCPACGYSLQGLTPPTRCPECAFDVDDKTLVLQGVAKTDASMSKTRRGLWTLFACLTGAWFIGYQAWSVTLGLTSGNTWQLGLLVLFSFLFLVAMLIGLVATSKRDRAGKTPIVFAKGGFAVVPSLTEPGDEATAVTWDRVHRIKLDRVSPFWYRLRIHSDHGTLLDAGVRCPDEHAELVRDTLLAFKSGLSSDATAAQLPGPR